MLFCRGIAKAKLNDSINALIDFDKAISIDATKADYYLHRGELKIKLGLKESGCADLKKCKELGGTPLQTPCN